MEVEYSLTDEDIDGESFAEWWRHMGKPKTVRFVEAFVVTHGEKLPQSVVDAAIRSLEAQA